MDFLQSIWAWFQSAFGKAIVKGVIAEYLYRNKETARFVEELVGYALQYVNSTSEFTMNALDKYVVEKADAMIAILNMSPGSKVALKEFVGLLKSDLVKKIGPTTNVLTPDNMKVVVDTLNEISSLAGGIA